MKNKAAVNGIIRLITFLLCAVMTVSLFLSCDETDNGGGEYKDPSQSDGGSDNSKDEGGADNGTDSDNTAEDESGIPTVEFPIIPFD